MDEQQFERLKGAAKARGDSRGVSAELQLVDMQGSSLNPPGRRILLRVFRLVQGQQPREYTNAAGFGVDTQDLQKRIELDIDVAAGRLYETR